jgi:hypothetical protein
VPNRLDFAGNFHADWSPPHLDLCSNRTVGRLVRGWAGLGPAIVRSDAARSASGGEVSAARAERNVALPEETPWTEKPWRRWRAYAAAGGLSLAVAAVASAQVRVVTWNLARLNGDPVAIEEVLATLAEDDRPGFAVAPAALVFQEVTSGSLAEVESLVENAAAPGVEYVRATYTSSPSQDGSGGAVALFYRSDLLSEIASGHRDIATGAGRDSDRWQMRLVGYPESIGTLWIYGAHLKASNDAASREARLAGAEALRADMQSLPAGSRVMLVGDLNLYSNNEDAYAALLAPGAGSLADPLGSGSWSGSGNAIKHSQSPRDAAGGGLVGGAMDDRFDFQLLSLSLSDGDGLDLIASTYRSVGNDGNHFDLAINDGNNTYFPGEIARSNALADALFDASDHLPVATDLRLPGILVASVDDAIGRVIRGTPLPIEVRVTNNAPADTPFASLPIEVDVVAIDGASGSETVFAPLAPGIAAAEVWLDTSSAGEIEVLIEARAFGEVANAVFPLQAIAEVLDPSRPSLSAKKPIAEIAMSVEVPPSGISTLAIPIHNLGYSPLQSLLEVDAVYGAAGAVSVASVPPAIGGVPGEIVLSIDGSALAASGWSGTIEIEVSDENVPGETYAALAVELAISVEPSGSPADLNGDGFVNGADLAMLLGQWGGAGSGDLTGDGIVNGADLAILLGAWAGG